MKVIKIKFKSSSKGYYFDPKGIDIKEGDKVLIKTLNGIELATSLTDVVELDKKEIIHPLKKIVNKASKEDLLKEEKNEVFLNKMIPKIKEKVVNNKLDMKILGCTATLNREKIIINFTSDGRVDFRQLVKELGSILKTRIELKQIGERDSAKLAGGIGPCGLPLCCSTFLGNFSTVSIKMAKNQNLSLNPEKLSGVCGKLFCCLKYENETYVELGKGMPKLGKLTFTPEGTQKVVVVNILKQEVTVSNQERERTVYKLEEIIQARKEAEEKGLSINPQQNQNNKPKTKSKPTNGKQDNKTGQTNKPNPQKKQDNNQNKSNKPKQKNKQDNNQNNKPNKKNKQENKPHQNTKSNLKNRQDNKNKNISNKINNDDDEKKDTNKSFKKPYKKNKFNKPNLNKKKVINKDGNN